MKYIYLFGMVAGMLSSQLAYAQDVVYLNDQTNVTGTLADITPEKVTLRVPKGEATIKFSYGVERVVAIVNQRGRYLCMHYMLGLPADERDRLIQQFLTSTNQPTSDAIIRLNPPEAIYGKVSYNQGDVVNYTTLDGAASSLPKSNVVAIFYSTGKHELLGDATTLCDNPNLLRPEPASVPVVTAPTTPEPASSTPEPAPVSLTPVAANPAPKPDETWATSPKPARNSGAKRALELTAEEYDDYRKQSLERVKDFSVLLGIVADKTSDTEAKNKATKRILSFFKPDAMIQISSMVRGGQANTYSISDYLRRLKLLPYASVTLEWANIEYIEELTQKNDGNYYGKIRGEQKFSGLNTNGEVQYGDITQKDVDVMLTPYQKRKEGADTSKWEILLGNIGVVATQ